jgi:hypothetical protein
MFSNLDRDGITTNFQSGKIAIFFKKDRILRKKVEQVQKVIHNSIGKFNNA